MMDLWVFKVRYTLTDASFHIQGKDILDHDKLDVNSL